MMNVLLRTEESPQYCPSCQQSLPLQSIHEIGESPCPHCGKLLWFVCRRIDGAVVLRFLPGLAAGSESLDLSGEVQTAVGDASRVVVNLGSLRLVSSMMLAMLVVLYRQAKAQGGTIVLCGLTPSARDALRVTRLDLLFEISDDETQALL